MTLRIENSVGKKGINRSGDVKLVQALINTISLPQFDAKLVVDGLSGPKTERAISSFQSAVVGMMRPDGRVDPGGRTLRALTANLTATESEQIKLMVAHPGARIKAPEIDQRRFRATAQKLNEVVVYHESVPASARLVSEYSKRIVAAAALESGMSRAVITSTFRTYQQQATIMLRNAKVDLDKQYRLYGGHGDAVLDIYDKNKGLSDQEIVVLMVDKIRELHASGDYVSKHCVSPESYVNYNVFDLGVNSNRAVNPNFDASAFNSALKSYKEKGLIAGLIDERTKSNNCWHVEIKVEVRNVDHLWDRVLKSSNMAYA
ncbi:peptidoglycan-binding protein [Marinobacter lacisalsi]|uniref:Peptidoglycan-binding protein n=1 Tax=Marinobacter lacisalsi TaxID=475979 RepID=A0ABV8QBS0_9GAMM